MPRIHLYVDDRRPCPAGFVLARDPQECLLILKEAQVDVLSLDHDMGWNCMNGTQLAQTMVERQLFARRIYLHSSSGMGRMAMFQLLVRAKPEGVQVYPHPLPEEILEEIAATAWDERREGGR